MEISEENVFTGKSVEEATEEGLKALGLTRGEAEITVIEEGKKKLFGGVKAKVKVTGRQSDGKRAADFIEGLLGVLKISAFCDLKADGDKVEIEIQATNSNSVIGRHGEVLDAIQCLAGAVANIGREEYKKVVVDCENYRAGREKTLTELAAKLAKKAVERGRKVTLEPMNPYERRIIHSALANNEEVKTVSDGKEPNRYVVIIPNNMKPYEKRDRREGKEGGRERYGNRDRRERRDFKDRGERRERSSSPRPARGKKEIHFGTYLGNSGNKSEE